VSSARTCRAVKIEKRTRRGAFLNGKFNMFLIMLFIKDSNFNQL
jgi:hypothetical protein